MVKAPIIGFVKITCLLVMLSAQLVRGDIFRWKLIDLMDPAKGIQESDVLTGGGAGAVAAPHQDLNRLDLAQAFLNGADLTGTTLRRADLTNASLVGSTLTGANFGHADLTNADFSGASIAGANFEHVLGFTAAQLYSTASYESHDLHGVTFTNSKLTDLNLTDQNLAGTRFGSELTGADLRGARGFTSNQVPPLPITNLIRPDGHVADLNIRAGVVLTIRDYDGGIPIQVDGIPTFRRRGTLRLLLKDDDWGSTISFERGTAIALAGDLEISLAQSVDPAALVGKSFQLFDWTGAASAGEFFLVSNLQWDTSNLYSTGVVTLVPEPAAIVVLTLGVLAIRRRRPGNIAVYP
jgi:hypothetical protein